MAERARGDISEIQKALRSNLDAKSKSLTHELRRALRRDGERWKGALQGLRGRLSLDAPKAPGEALARRSGSLARSLGYDVSGDSLDTLTLRKFTTSRYGRVHELGTVGAGGKLPDIVPVNRQWLTIPTARALTPAGVPRRPGARSYDLRFILLNEQTALLVEPDKPLSEALYILRKRVAIPPRLGMQKTHEAHREVRARDILEAIRRGLAA